MKTKFVAFGIPVLFAFVLSSCQPSVKQKNPVIERAENQLEDFRNSLDEISEDDPQFSQKLKHELAEFNETMDTLGQNLEMQGDTADSEIRNAITNIRQETMELDQKLAMWESQAQQAVDSLRSEAKKDSVDSLDSLGVEIRKDFRELKTALREQIRSENSPETDDNLEMDDKLNN
ncbi:MAG: hypothetical protein AAGU19_12825 [Prolixibacteraceae bacterium]